MKDEALNTYLKDIKNDPAFDKEFVDLLISTQAQGDEGEKIAEKVIFIVNKRYVKGQKNQT
jgi:hypothetical protein